MRLCGSLIADDNTLLNWQLSIFKRIDLMANFQQQHNDSIQAIYGVEAAEIRFTGMFI